MTLNINNHTYNTTEYSTEDNIILVEKTVDVVAQAYTDFRTVTSFELDGTAYTGRTFTGANLIESGGNIQATYNTTSASGVDPVTQDKANGYDILTGGI